MIYGKLVIRFNKILFTIFIIIIFISVVQPLPIHSNSNIDNEKDFAAFLFRNGYYKEAVSVYLYLYYSSESTKNKAHYAYMAGKCYLENGDLKEAEYLFRSFLNNDKITKEFEESFYIDFSRSLYFQKKFHEVPYEIEQTFFYTGSFQLKEIAAWSYINTGNWDKASLLFDEIVASTDNQRIAEIALQLKKRPDFNEKSPLTAAIMSALLPGAGHAYADNWASAFGAFTVNLIFGSLTAYSVYKKRWIYATVFGVMEVGWYTGNIASAYQEAEIYNKSEENKFKLKLSANFPIEFKISNR